MPFEIFHLTMNVLPSKLSFEFHHSHHFLNCRYESLPTKQEYQRISTPFKHRGPAHRAPCCYLQQTPTVTYHAQIIQSAWMSQLLISIQLFPALCAVFVSNSMSFQQYLQETLYQMLPLAISTLLDVRENKSDY